MASLRAYLLALFLTVLSNAHKVDLLISAPKNATHIEVRLSSENGYESSSARALHQQPERFLFGNLDGGEYLLTAGVQFPDGHVEITERPVYVE
jgi:hypothetical protein